MLIMKRRYANLVEGDYKQKRIDEDYFNGFVCNIKINGVKKPLIVNNGVSEICIKDNGYEWFEIYPDNENYAITIMFDNKLNLIEWYFDIAKEVGVDNGVPYEDDLYLDMIITPDGKKIVLDELELIDAYNRGEIKQADVDLAYRTLEKLDNMYLNNFDNLINLSNKICELFESENRI